jgi:hypothetical protein
VAKILFASFATAYAGGTPKKIKKGVIKKPPPTPKRPDRTPTIALRRSISIALMLTSAIGKYTSIDVNYLIFYLIKSKESSN